MIYLNEIKQLSDTLETILGTKLDASDARSAVTRLQQYYASKESTRPPEDLDDLRHEYAHFIKHIQQVSEGRMTFLEAAKTVEIPSFPGAEDLIPFIQRLIRKVFISSVLCLLLPSRVDLPLALFALIAIDGKTFKCDAFEASKTMKTFQHHLFWVMSPDSTHFRREPILSLSQDVAFRTLV